MQIWHLGRSARIVTNEHVWERELSSELNDWGMIAFLIRLEHKLGKKVSLFTIL